MKIMEATTPSGGVFLIKIKDFNQETVLEYSFMHEIYTEIGANVLRLGTAVPNWRKIGTVYDIFQGIDLRKDKLYKERIGFCK